MRVLVTGGAGFIGSHLVDRLITEGHEIVVIDNLFRGRLQNIERHLSLPTFNFHGTDIRDYDALKRHMQGCHIVFHFAAQSNVMGAVQDSDYSFESNVTGTYQVLKAARENGVRRLVFSSSREVYGEAKYIPVDEKHPLEPKNFYGASKVAGEKYCEIFQQMDYFEVVIVRLANVYGHRDYQRVIPIFIESLKKHEDIHIYGGDQIIDFIAIEIVVETLIQAMDNSKVLKGPINAGSGKGTTLFELAQRLKGLLDTKSKVIVEPPRSAEVVRYTADIRQFRSVFDIPVPEDPLYYLPMMTGADNGP